MRIIRTCLLGFLASAAWNGGYEFRSAEEAVMALESQEAGKREAAATYLVKLVEDQSPGVREALLSHPGTLRKALGDTSDAVSGRIVAVLAGVVAGDRQAGRSLLAEVGEQIVSLLARSEYPHMNNAARVLAYMDQPPRSALDACIRLATEHEEAVTRNLAILTLLRLSASEDSAEDTLQSLLENDPDPSVRRYLVRTIGVLGSTEDSFLSLLSSGLRDQDAAVVGAALDSLIGLGATDSILVQESLHRLVNDPSRPDALRQKAEKALAASSRRR